IRFHHLPVGTTHDGRLLVRVEVPDVLHHVRVRCGRLAGGDRDTDTRAVSVERDRPHGTDGKIIAPAQTTRVAPAHPELEQQLAGFVREDVTRLTPKDDACHRSTRAASVGPQTLRGTGSKRRSDRSRPGAPNTCTRSADTPPSDGPPAVPCPSLGHSCR